MADHFDWIKGFFFPYINFLIFCVLLIMFSRKALKEMFAKRRQDFLALVEAAKRAQTEAEEKLRDLNRRLEELDVEVVRIKESARQEGEEEAKRIIEQGKILALFIKDEARRVAQAELMQARSDLQKDLLCSVHEQVRSKLCQDMTMEAQKQHIQKQFERLRAVSTGG